MAPARKGFLFCDESLATRAELPLQVIANTYQIAGHKIPSRLGDEMRRLKA